MSEQVILRKQPHPVDDPNVNNPEGCCSSDAVSVYADGSACCYSCGFQLFKHPDTYGYNEWAEGKDVPSFNKGAQRMSQDNTNAFDVEKRLYEAASFKSFPDRNVTIQTAQQYGVKTTASGLVYFPYFNRDFKLSGFKIRTPDKDFRIIGKVVGEDILLFGQQLFKGGGKYVTIHEGEFDALAGYQMMGSKYPNLSIPTGTKGGPKACRLNLDYLDSFERKVLSMDGDKPGIECADNVAPLFTPGTCQIMHHPEERKDACEYSKTNMGGLFYSMFWDAKLYTPSGIVNLADDFEALFERDMYESHPYPWVGLNEKTRGFRKKELVTICAGSGLGKSAITREINKHILDTTEDNIGVLYLEETPTRTKLGLMGMYADKPLHLDEVFKECSREEIMDAFEKSVGSGRLFAYDHFGSCSVDEILNRVRYLIKGLECSWVILDHLSIIVSGLEGDDERKNIDVIMTKLRTLVEETGAGLFLVSHLKRVGTGANHEQGGQISLSHLRGSQSIAQLSDVVIGLERDQQATNPILANTTQLRVLKNRYTGSVGPAGYLLYDKDTGRMSEITEEDLEMVGDDGTSEF
jgi:twinkle protein